MTSDRGIIPNKYTRFFSKVNAGDFNHKKCWPWTGAGKGNGYGNVRLGKRNVAAHRYAYEIMVGPVPDGMDVCHTCDNRWCVNPDHLYVGTRKQNMTDCRNRGRAAGGNRKHLKEVDVQEIHRRLNAGMSPRQVAETMDVNYSTVSSIQKGNSYVGQR